MKFSILALTTLGAAALTACGGGAEIRDRSEPVRALLSSDVMLFVDFDADHDFNVSMAEVDAGIEREFARADSNHDGALGPIEFQSWSNQVLGGGMTPPYRLDFDRNVDNSISAEEFRSELRARARAYDSNEDGVISRAEFIRQLNQARPAAPRTHVDDDGPGGAGGRGPDGRPPGR